MAIDHYIDPHVGNLAVAVNQLTQTLIEQNYTGSTIPLIRDLRVASGISLQGAKEIIDAVMVRVDSVKAEVDSVADQIMASGATCTLVLKELARRSGYSLYQDEPF